MDLFKNMDDISNIEYFDYNLRELEKLRELRELRLNYKTNVYKEITKYAMIAVERKIKKNEQAKKLLDIECEEKSNLEFDKPLEQRDFHWVKHYEEKRNEYKTDWKTLEIVLKEAIAERILNKVKPTYLEAIKKLLKIVNFEFKDEYAYIISGIELDEMVERNMEWLKRHYNSLRMIKLHKNKASKNYYYRVIKPNNKYLSLSEANKQIGLNKVDKSKKLVLNTALKLNEQKIKITIASITKEIANNGSKTLGKTQVAKYLKELREEGQL